MGGQARARQRLPAISSQGLLPNQDLPPQRVCARRDLREHPQARLEAGPGDKAHPPHRQVSADRAQPGVCPQRGGGKASPRALRRLLFEGEALHRDPRALRVKRRGCCLLFLLFGTILVVLLNLNGSGLKQWGGGAEKSDKERKVIEGQKEDFEAIIGRFLRNLTTLQRLVW